jgi:Sulfotransferase family
VDARWRHKRSFFARALGRLRQRKDPEASPLPVPSVDRTDRRETAPPIFIVGCQRSGTSLLRRIFDSHSRIACPPESQFILPLIEILQGKTASVDDKYLSGLASMGYSRSAVETALARFISGFFDDYAASQGKVRWADKSPLYVDCLPELWAMFGPRVRFVLLVRNGLDVAFSLSDASRDYPAIRRHVAASGGNVPIGAGLFWAEQNSKIEAFRASWPDACIQVRYEELTTDPAASLEPVFAFVSEAWEPGVIDYHRFPHHRGFEDPEVRRRSRIEPNSGRYRAWPKEVQAAVRAACEPVLTQLGYEQG